jgi:hypothetical protein
MYTIFPLILSQIILSKIKLEKALPSLRANKSTPPEENFSEIYFQKLSLQNANNSQARFLLITKRLPRRVGAILYPLCGGCHQRPTI